MKPNSHIALFGSSFNPPHRGHLAVVQDLLARRLFDEIWLVPVYAHPFRKDLPDFATRLTLTQMLVAELADERVKICTIEADLAATPSYTFDTVTALKKKYPHDDFTLIVGSDVQNELDKWHNIAGLKNLVTFYFVPRQGFADSPYPQVSSSDVREKCRAGESVAELTTPAIAKYLKENKIYHD